ncbi:MAG: UDP-glucose 4-epimerase [Gammaproteobacteria bacterium (ex Lamellibrachia satsuma)]|nr:MAG: UDP-glucose 4-epimerase GalE [Gammaproteobacteria bacterium (ex Lamellibrachia satsuma)]RRS34831.1 MAG: UDP-glucose 4-epimerase [Gammaproteobacteria bacterium (ex Lamellibrachia satsuma)]RRS35790.1 MAG: UDP-glucose 4-epimerase [Gammaproteobacteria bacterium (ex Lamellibrachia satsuma)]
MANKGILITGGAGYIGSHTARQLGEAGERLITLDNLSTGFREAVLYGELVVGDTGDQALVSRVLKEHDIDTVLHFAAHTVVPESVEDPLKYYGNNTCNTRSMLQCCAEAGVKNFIFSSTAAVYGTPGNGIAHEDTPTSPINPYGTSKLMSEWMLRDLSAATAMKHVILRYFNVAGCDPEGRIGQATPNATLLTKVACEAAVGKRDSVYIYGTDYPTPDGTGVRDYIHVEDLAAAHVKAIEHLRRGGDSAILNCGYGHGFSVREMLQAVEKAGNIKLDIIEADRRAGDPPALIAGAEKVREVLGWSPAHDDLSVIAGSALNWEKKLLKSPWKK